MTDRRTERHLDTTTTFAMNSDAIAVIVNGKSQHVPVGTSIAGLLEQLQLRRQHVAVELNRELIPRERHDDRPLAAGDQLEIVTLVGGG
jgi:sulfur carrier protein